MHNQAILCLADLLRAPPPPPLPPPRRFCGLPPTVWLCSLPLSLSLLLLLLLLPPPPPSSLSGSMSSGSLASAAILAIAADLAWRDGATLVGAGDATAGLLAAGGLLTGLRTGALGGLRNGEEGGSLTGDSFAFVAPGDGRLGDCNSLNPAGSAETRASSL